VLQAVESGPVLFVPLFFTFLLLMTGCLSFDGVRKSLSSLAFPRFGFSLDPLKFFFSSPFVFSYFPVSSFMGSQLGSMSGVRPRFSEWYIS